MLGFVDGFLVEIGEDTDLTITAADNGDTITPVQLRLFEADSETRNIKKDLLNGDFAITLIGDGLPSGQLGLTFDTDSEAAAARAILRRPTTFSLVSASRPALNMTFVRNGSLRRTIHDELHNLWLFDVGFQEIDA